MEKYAIDPKNRYFIRQTNDFGDHTGFWKVFYAKPVEYVEYVSEMASPYGVWYYHNRYIGGGPAGQISSYAKMQISMDEFNLKIRPYVINEQKDEDMKDERKAAGWIVDLVAKTVKEELDKQMPKEVKPEADFEFAVGDTVFKNKGDYNLEGVVVGQFKMLNGAKRYVIEHQAQPKGSFCHIYSDTQLELVKKGTR